MQYIYKLRRRRLNTKKKKKKVATWTKIRNPKSKSVQIAGLQGFWPVFRLNPLRLMVIWLLSTFIDVIILCLFSYLIAPRLNCAHPIFKWFNNIIITINNCLIVEYYNELIKLKLRFMVEGHPINPNRLENWYRNLVI